MSNFHPLKVVNRGSETQLQVGENINCIYYIYLALKGLTAEALVVNNIWISEYIGFKPKWLHQKAR